MADQYGATPRSGMSGFGAGCEMDEEEMRPARDARQDGVPRAGPAREARQDGVPQAGPVRAADSGVREVWAAQIGSFNFPRARAAMTSDGKSIVVFKENNIGYGAVVEMSSVADTVARARLPRTIAAGSIDAFTLSPDDFLVCAVSGPVAGAAWEAKPGPRLAEGNRYSAVLENLRDPSRHTQVLQYGRPSGEQELHYVGSAGPNNSFQLLMITKDGRVSVNFAPVRVAAEDEAAFRTEQFSFRGDNVAVAPSLGLAAVVCGADIFILSRCRDDPKYWEARRLRLAEGMQRRIDGQPVSDRRGFTVEYAQQWSRPAGGAGNWLGVRWGRHDGELLVYGSNGLLSVNPADGTILRAVCKEPVNTAAVARTGDLVVCHSDGWNNLYDLNEPSAWCNMGPNETWENDANMVPAIRVDISPDGRTILVCTCTGVRIFEVRGRR
jgi:hypothetical protein